MRENIIRHKKNTSSMLQQYKDRVRHYAPESLYPLIAMPYFYFHPRRDCISIRKKGSVWKAKNLRQNVKFYYPSGQNAGRISKGGVEKGDLYQFPGKVEVEQGDTVVDTGAYVGEFTSVIAPTADRILAIEPDPRSVKCLELNTKDLENITIKQTLLDSEKRKQIFQLGSDPTENSLFGIDAGHERDVVSMETDTLSEVCKDHGIKMIDFLKLEAEGAEPEILQGSDAITIRKIAAGVGPERNGENTRDRVANLLLERDYDLVGERNNVLFATLNTDTK